MTKKLFIGLGIIIIIGLGLLVLKEFWHKKPIPDIIELPIKYGEGRPRSTTENTDLIPTEQIPENILQYPLVTSAIEQNQPVLLFNTPLGFTNINFPNLYAYNYTSKSIRIFNLEEKTFSELYSNPNIDFVSFSPSKKLVAFRETKNGFSKFYLLDLIKDKIYSLGIFTKTVAWSNNNELIYYFSNDSTVNYIGKISNGKNEKLVDVGVVNPSIGYQSGKLFFASEKNSPLFLFDSKTKSSKIILNEKLFISFLLGDKFIFASFFDQKWQSVIMDLSGNILQKFNWGTLSEKCAFEKMLICGVPQEQNNMGLIEDWQEMREATSDKLITIDLKTFETKEIEINKGFDIVAPKIIPTGIIFINRTDSKLYAISTSF